ncbi:MAG: hypothetical protein ACK528_07595 [Alphaproteobacteria bacterium]
MGIKSNLIITLDEDVVSGDISVIALKTTDAGNIVVECNVPKVAVKLEDLEETVRELRNFFTTKKHIDVVANSTHVVDSTNLSFTYTEDE